MMMAQLHASFKNSDVLVYTDCYMQQDKPKGRDNVTFSDTVIGGARDRR